MTDFVLNDETLCVKKMIEDTVESKVHLSPWEVGFCLSLLKWSGNLTQRQAEMAVRLCASKKRPNNHNSLTKPKQRSSVKVCEKFIPNPGGCGTSTTSYSPIG
jgi:hypothetical protein